MGVYEKTRRALERLADCICSAAEKLSSRVNSSSKPERLEGDGGLVWVYRR